MEETLLVPRSAVLQTGERSMVFHRMSNGQLHPMEVVTGLSSGDQVQILSGLREGHVVVASATFLIDAESNLGAAMAGMAGMDHSMMDMGGAGEEHGDGTGHGWDRGGPFRARSWRDMAAGHQPGADDAETSHRLVGQEQVPGPDSGSLRRGGRGSLAMAQIPLEAIPDLSDVQVIIQTDYQGQAPQLVEDQVTYPIASEMLKVPGAQTVRGFSFFGVSFVYIIFEDGTDIYWARSRVLEYLSGIQGRLPEGADVALGPDATGLGWVYQYVLEDTSGTHSLADLRSIQDWFLRYQLTSVPGVSEVASVGGFERMLRGHPGSGSAPGVRHPGALRSWKPSGPRTRTWAPWSWRWRNGSTWSGASDTSRSLGDIESVVLGASRDRYAHPGGRRGRRPAWPPGCGGEWPTWTAEVTWSGASWSCGSVRTLSPPSNG